MKNTDRVALARRIALWDARQTYCAVFASGTVRLVAILFAAIVILMGTMAALHAQSAPEMHYASPGIVFAPVQGGSQGASQFAARATGMTVELDEHGMSLTPSRLASKAALPQRALRVDLLGALPHVEMRPESVMPARGVRYSRSGSKSSVVQFPLYGSVRYAQVYRGIDLAFYGRNQHLEYDFVVTAGADPGQIHLAVGGAESALIDARGDLVMAFEGQQIRFRKPVAYQGDGAGRREVKAAYSLQHGKDGRSYIGFSLSAYDRGQPLVIDPVLDYARYVGSGFDQIGGLAVNEAGDVYVASGSGYGAVDLQQIGTDGRLQNSVTVALGSKNVVLQSTAVVASGHLVYVTGYAGPGLPTTSNAARVSIEHGVSAYLLVFESVAGSFRMKYASYLGGRSNSYAYHLAVDASGVVYVAGSSAGSDFPTTQHALQQTAAVQEGASAFVVGVDPERSNADSILSSTLFGSGARIVGIAAGSAGSVYLLHDSDRLLSLIGGGIQLGQGRYGKEIQMTHLDTTAGRILDSVNLGEGRGTSIAADAAGRVYVAGVSAGSALHSTPGAYRAGQSGGFVARLSAQGGALEYVTYLGGAGVEPTSIAVNRSCKSECTAAVTGILSAPGFPVVDSIQSESAIYPAAFSIKLSANGDTARYATVLGGETSPVMSGSRTDEDGIYRAAPQVETDAQGKVHVAGNLSAGSDGVVAFPVTVTDSGGSGFLASIADRDEARLVAEPGTLQFSETQVGTVGSPLHATVRNMGSVAARLISMQATPAAEFVANASNCGSSLAAGASCSVDVAFYPATSGLRVGELRIESDASASPLLVALRGAGVNRMSAAIASGIRSMSNSGGVVALSPSSLAFGSVLVGSGSSALTATLLNGSSVPVTIGSVTLGGLNASRFAFATPAPSGACVANLAVAPGGSCSVTVKFTPVLGTAVASVVLVDSAGTQTLDLSANGIAYPVPFLTSIAPRPLVPGAASTTLTVSGANFMPGAVVRWNGVSLGTTTASSARLTATVPASLIASSSSSMVTVMNSKPTGVLSNLLPVSVSTAASAIGFTGSLFPSLAVNQPVAMLTLDINGDSKSDLVVLDALDASLLSYLNAGSGRLALKSSTPLGCTPTAVAASDLNEDGKTDLAVLCTNGFVTPLVGDGAGNFSVVGGFAATLSGQAIAAADLNSDGHIDLAVLDAGNHVINLFWGNGLNGFAAASSIAAGSSPFAEIVFDANRDGILDLAVGNADGTVTILLGAGGGAFNSGPIVLSASSAIAMVSGDWNEDGISDLALASSDGTISLLNGDGNGGFSADTSVASSGGLTALSTMDLNSDGHADLVVTGPAQAQAMVYYGTGQAGFTAGPVLTTTAAPTMLAVADLDGSGYPDLLVGSLTKNSVQLLIQEPIASISATSFAFGQQLVNTTSASRSFTIANVGTMPLTLTSLGISPSTNTGANDFAFTSNCGSLPASIRSGGICQVSITFTPSKAANESATFGISDTSGGTNSNQTLSLSGVGVATSSTSTTLTASSIVFGDTALLTATVKGAAGDPTGTVTLTVVGTTYQQALNNGVAVFSVPGLAAGSYPVSASYAAQNNFQASSASASVVVTPAATSLIVSAPSITYGEAAQLTATVKSSVGTPTGTVTLTVAGTAYQQSLSNGVAVFSVPGLAAGSYPASVSYAAQGNYQASAASASVVVNPAATSLVVSAPSITYGETAQLTATVKSSVGDPAGTVTLTVAGTAYQQSLSNGVAVFSVPGLAAGSYPASVSYAAQGNYQASAASASVVVNPAATSLVVSAPSITYGETAQLTATVKSPVGDPTGTVTVTVAGTAYQQSLSNGVAVFSVPGLAAGSYPVSASYAAQNNFQASAASASVVVTSAATSLMVSAPSITYGEAAQLTATVKSSVGTPTGTVTLTVAGTTYQQALNNGVAIFSVPGLAAGSYPASVSYAAQGNYQASAASASVVVTPAATSLVVSAPDSVFGQPIAVSVSVASGVGVPSGSVTLTMDGVSVGAQLLDAGTTSFTVNGVQAGAHSLQASFIAQGSYASSSNVVQLGVARATPILLWPIPQPMQAGTQLSATQLNATSNVVGSFVYQPAAGSTLGVGVNQTLTALFTPADLVDYSPASITTTIAVTANPAPFVRSVEPLSITADAAIAGFTVTVRGTNLRAESVVSWNGTALATQLNSAGVLTAQVPAGMVAGLGTALITVANPAPSGVVSNANPVHVGTQFDNLNLAPLATVAASQPAGVLVRDFNGDGLADLAVLNAANGTVAIYVGNGSGWALQSTTVVGSQPNALVSGDFNEDGRIDLAVTCANGALTVLAGDGAGNFTVATTLSAGSTASTLTVADVNGDGHLDLVVLNPGANALTVLTGDGAGGFSSAVQLATGVDPYGALLSDFDGDGWTDAAVGNADGTVSIYRNNQTGDLVAAGTVSIGTAAVGFKTGDWNEDGVADLVVAAADGTLHFLSGAGNGSFGASSSITLADAASTLNVADMNGDGHADMVFTSASTNTLIVLYGDGHGTFGAPVTLAATAGVQALELADVNNDGRVDAVLASASNNSIPVLTQSPQAVLSAATVDFGSILYGTPSAAQSVTLSNNGPLPLVLSSLVLSAGVNTADGDFSSTNDCGTLPAVLQPGSFCTLQFLFKPSFAGVEGATLTLTDNSSNQSAVSQTITLSGTGVLLATQAAVSAPAINFGDAAMIGVSATSPGGIVTGTVTLSVAGSNLTQELINGASSFTIPSLPAGSYPVTASITGTNGFDATTASTMLVVNKLTPVLQWAQPVSMATAVALSATQLNATANVAGSFVYQPAAGSTLGVGANQMLTAIFTPTDSVDYNPTSIATTITVTANPVPAINPVVPSALSPGAIAAGVSLDLVGTGFGPATSAKVNGTVVPATATGTTKLTLAIPPSLVVSSGVATLLVANPEVSKGGVANPVLLPVTTATSSLQFALTGSRTLAVNRPAALAAGDFNGDGFQDLAVLNTRDNLLSIYLGTAGGTFTFYINISVGANAVAAAVGDFNEDGKLDLAIASSSGVVTLLKGNGAGYFTALGSFVAGTNTVDLAVADLNQDGHLDLAIVNATSSQATAWMGNGAGSFQLSATVATGSQPYRILAADFNGDGFPDLAVGNGDGTVSIYRASATGTFSLASTIATGAPASSVVLGDWNEDSIPDLAVGNTTGNISILLGDGSGGFNAVQLLPVATGSGSITIGDFNGDGHLDLAAASRSNNSVVIFVGAGDGSFASTATIATSVSPSALVAIDMNSDGRTDLIVPSSDANLIATYLQVPIGSSSTTSLNFGSPITGVRSDAQQVVLTNNGSAAWILAAISITPGTNATQGDFAQNNDCGTLPATLAPGASCTVYASLSASTNQAETATLTIVSNSGLVAGSAITVALADNGSSSFPTQMALVPGPSVDFGNPATAAVTVSSNYGTPTGKVKLVVDGLPAMTSTLINGSATFTLSGLGAGTHQLNASFASQGSFDASLSAGSIVIRKATPSTSWSVPLPINVGTALSTIQLNATASVAGSFSYTPAAGTALPLGNNQTLSSVFTPTDIADYNTAIATTSINVTALATPISISPAGLNFNTQTYNTYSTTQNVVIQNTGTAAILLKTLSIITVGNSNSTYLYFSMVTGTGSCVKSVAMAPGTSCVVQVRFKPLAVGAAIGLLNVGYTVGSSTTQILQTVSLAGSGVAYAIPHISPVLPSAVLPTTAASGFNLVVPGSGLTSSSVVSLNGKSLTTQLISNNGVPALQAAVPAGLITSESTAVISVANPKLTGLASNLRSVSFTNPLTTTNFTLGPFTANAINQPVAVLAVDLTGDRYSDMVVLNATDKTVATYVNATSGREVLSSTVSLGSTPVSVVPGDFNEDGKIDLAVASTNGQVTILIGAGNGTFTALTPFAAGTSASRIAAADLNSDGHWDLAVTDLTANTVAVWIGSGTGSFASAATLATGPAPYGVVSGDFNLDGLPDLAVGNSDGSISIFVATSAGGFLPVSMPTTGTSAVALSIGDFNEDGNSDLAVLNANGTVSVLSGTGTGLFNLTSTSNVGNSPKALTVADLNGDGHLDIAVTNTADSTVSFLFGTGAGSFAPQATLAVAAQPLSITAADVNNDGRIDIAVSSGGANAFSVLMQTPMTSVSTSTLAFGSMQYGQTSVAQTFTVSNVGSGPLAVTSFQIHPGYNSQDFAMTTNCGTAPLTLNPQTSCWVTATYTPTRLGSEAATFQVVDNSNNVPNTAHYVTLTGTGLADPTSLTLSAPTATTYGALVPVTVSVTSPVSVPNGLVTLSIGSNAVLTQRLSAAGTATFPVTGLPAGTYVITASYQAQYQFAGSSAASILSVQQATPSISWPSPGAIQQGTPLTAAQLNATASVAGVFTYTPAAGTVLGVGVQSLSASFIPTDAANYTSTTASNTLNVLSASSLFVAPSAISFGSVAQGTTSAQQSVLLVNGGAVPVALTGIVLSDSANGSFQLASPAPNSSCMNVGGTLAPAASCTIDVVWTPQTIGNVGGTLLVANDSSSGPLTIALNGLGVLSPTPFILTATPTAIPLATAAQGFSFRVLGSGFVNGSAVVLNGSSVPTTRVSSTTLLATVPAGVFSVATTVRVAVLNPGTGGVRSSNVMLLPITSPTAGVALGTGGFTSTSINTPQGFVITDLNGDGIADVAILDAQDNQLLVYLGTGSGTLNLQSTTGVAANPVALANGDFNEDGLQDLVVLSSDGTYQTWYGDGAGNYTAGGTTTAAVAGNTISAADLNNDGHTDVAVVNTVSQNVAILLGNGAGGFIYQDTLHTGVAPFGIAIADLDKDGNLDVAVGDGDGTIGIFLGRGDGTFTLATSVESGATASAIAVSDFNEDGVPDLILVNNNLTGAGSAGAVSVWTGQGNGLFSYATSVPVGVTPGTLATADFNGDGHMDFSIASYYSNYLQVALGTGTGSFNILAPVSAGNRPTALGVADFNGDGRPDLLVADSASNSMMMLLQVPQASLSTSTLTFPVQSVGTASAPMSVTISNTGTATAPLVITSIAVTSAFNTAASDFTQSNYCGALPAVLAPGASCTISITFKPSSVASESATLTITDNDGNIVGSTQQVAITGTTPLPAGVLATTQIGLTPGRAIPSNFLGFSFDWNTIESWMGSTSAGWGTTFQKMLSNLMAYNSGPLVLRVAGDSIATGTISSATAAPFSQLAQNINVHYILGLNLDLATLSLTQSQAQIYAAAIPNDRIDAFEIGNEPDNYIINGARGSNYGVQPYLADIATYQQGVAAVVPTLQRFADPGLAGSTWMTGIEAGIQAGQLPGSIVTQHSYITCNNKTNPSALDLLLQPYATTSAPRLYGPYAALAHQAGALFRMGEMNSICNGGQTGLSNNFTAALWSVDTMFAFANAGIDGVNWHTASGSSYNPFNITATTKSGKNVFTLSQVNPLYYGLLMFAQAAGNGAQLLPITTLTGANLDTWATIDASGVIHLVIINKDESAAGAVQFSAAGYTSGTAYPLTASSYTATTGVRYAGQTFDGSTDGSIQGTLAATTIAANNGVFSVSVPATSAVLINLTQ